MTRRRFAFWIGMGLFGLAERLGAEELDELAAAVMRATEGDPPPPPTDAPLVDHWRIARNSTWRWFEQERLRDGEWRLVGMTRPTRLDDGAPVHNEGEYLDESLVPAEMLEAAESDEAEITIADDEDPPGPLSDATRRARHGRPPSRWLRSLNADELSVWLRTIDPPEATVAGMTFVVHLTRDHGFEEARVSPLSEEEQAKLHAAAHFGY